MVVNGVVAIVAGYLLGSIPTAYIAARLIKGKDIRQLGGGNIGARNAFHEVGAAAGIAVGIFDAGKGVAAVAIAYWLLGAPQLWLLGMPQLFLLAAGLAAVAGHIWSIYLKFTGGNGLATTMGVLAFLMTQEFLIALAITLVLVVITRNPVLSVNISFLLSVPVSAWFVEKSWLAVVFSVALALILVIHFIPTAKAAVVKAGSRENLSAELLRRDKVNK